VFKLRNYKKYFKKGFSLTWCILRDALKGVVPDEEAIKDEQDHLPGHDPPEHIGCELHFSTIA
jgi:hypothetical protein